MSIRLVAAAFALVLVAGVLGTVPAPPPEGTDNALTTGDPAPAWASTGHVPAQGPSASDPVRPGGMDPVFWEQNIGQWPGDVLWALRGPQPVALTAEGIHLPGPEGAPAVAMRPLDGAPLRPAPLELLSSTTSVFAPEGTFVGARHAARLHAPDVWPGIGVDLYFTPEGAFEFDLVLEPHADLTKARFAVEGAQPRLEDGALVLGSLVFAPPISFQDGHGVPSGFVVEDGVVGFHARHDPGLPLRIDPILGYGTIVRSEDICCTSQDATYAIATTDTSLYAAGLSYSRATYVYPEASQDFPTASSFWSNHDLYVLHLDKETHDLQAYIVFRTNTGPGFAEPSLDVTPDGTIYVAAGVGGAAPVANSTYATPSGSAMDPWFARLSPLPDTLPVLYGLDFATFIPASPWDDRARGVMANPDGTVWVAGHIRGTSLPAAPMGSAEPTASPSSDNVFATLWAPGPTLAILAASVVGGGGSDTTFPGSFDTDATGALYFSGITSSNNLPTTADALEADPLGNMDGFYGKFGTDASLLHLSYWGSVNRETNTRLTVAGEDEVILVGTTAGNGFAPPGCCVPLTEVRPFWSALGGSWDAYVSHIDIAAAEVLLSTHLGSFNNDEAGAVAFDAARSLYYVGGAATKDPLEPIAPFPYTVPKPMRNTGIDGFVQAIDPARRNDSASLQDQTQMIKWTMYVGGASTSRVHALHVDGMDLFVGGAQAGNPSAPTTPDALFTSGGTQMDGFLQHYTVAADLTLDATAGGVTKTTPQDSGLQVSTMVPITLSVTLTATDFGATGADIQWDLDADTAFDDGLGEGPFTLVRTTEASQQVCAQVVDPGAFALPLKQCLDLFWGNRPPQPRLEFFTADHGSVAGMPRYFRGEDIWFDGTLSSDPDGYIVLEETQWAHTPSVTAAAGTGSMLAMARHEDLGTKKVEIEVFDELGASAKRSLEYYVDNHPPHLECSLDGAVRVGRWIDVAVSDVHDIDGSIAQWSLSVSPDHPSLDGSGTPPARIRSLASVDAEGPGTATLTVRDNDGSSAQCLMPYEAGPRGLTADFTWSDATDGGATRLFDASRSLPDRPVLAWQWSVDGRLVSSDRNPSVPLTEGVHMVQLTVTDGIDTDTYTQAVVVAPPLAGPLALIAGAPGPYPAHIPLQFEDVSRPGDSPIVGRLWTLPGGATSTDRAPITALSPGEHMIRLTVEDEAGRTATDELLVHVVSGSELVPRMTVEDVEPVVGQKVRFVDSTNTGHFDLIGRLWDFGDGATAQDRVVWHTYKEPGEYRAVLTLYEQDERHFVSQVIHVRAEPGAPQPTPPAPADTVPVSAGEDRVVAPGSIVRLEGEAPEADAWHWEQVGGPGTILLGTATQTPSVAIPYTEGEIVLRLTVGTPQGPGSDEVRLLIGERADVAGQVAPPAADFAVETAGLAARFVAPAHAVPVEYVWTFGDGTTATGQDARHVYLQPGDYDVTLHMVDAHDREDRVERVVRVGDREALESQSLATEEVRIAGFLLREWAMALGVLATAAVAGLVIMRRR